MQDFILGKKGELYCFFVFLLLITISLNACTVDMYAGTRPLDYPNSVWVCESPYVRVAIGMNKEIRAFYKSELGEVEFQLLFGYGDDVDAVEAGTNLISDETLLFRGHCVFSDDHFTIFLSTDNVWDGTYYKLYFVRAS